MIAGLKPYPEYRDSGSEWLRKVPSHWEVRNLRTLIRPRNERNCPALPLLSVAREKGVFVRSLVDDENHNVIPEDLRNYKVARSGDLVINKMKAWQGSMGVSPCDGIVSPAYYVFTFDIANRYFGQILLRSKPYVAHFSQVSDGVRIGQWDLRIEGMKQIPVLTPSPEEQDNIVTFMEWATNCLDRSIRAKRKVIALLNEQKQATIHRAVIRGLDPTVPLKPSNIPWLGEIPEHWSEVRSKFLFREVNLRSSSGMETHLSMSQKYGLIPASQIEEKRLVSETYVGAKLCEKGDLVLNRLKAHLGVFALVSEPGLVSPDYTVLRPIITMDPRYFEAVYRTPACRVELRSRAKGIVEGFWRLYTDDFYNIRVPVPTTGEQQQIMDKLEVELMDFKNTVANLEREMMLLSDYRSRLITEVVTGKLDVREATAHLPMVTSPSLVKNDESDLDEIPLNEDLDDEEAEA